MAGAADSQREAERLLQDINAAITTTKTAGLTQDDLDTCEATVRALEGRLDKCAKGYRKIYKGIVEMLGQATSTKKSDDAFFNHKVAKLTAEFKQHSRRHTHCKQIAKAIMQIDRASQARGA